MEDPRDMARLKLWAMFESAPAVWSPSATAFIGRTGSGKGWFVRSQEKFLQFLLQACDVFLLKNIDEGVLLKILMAKRDRNVRVKLIVEAVREYPDQIARDLFQNALLLISQTKKNEWHIPNQASKERFFNAVIDCVVKGGIVFGKDAEYFIESLLLQRSKQSLQEEALRIKECLDRWQTSVSLIKQVRP